ncbi:glycosyltransferase family 2 protein [Olleya namhaensis]|uniref:glycosyltransferase family 2 protein n=1 Tax=Olleya namhaensis TaxID=1144750 RepID=UPI00232CB392|nr:glycosyltransferase [Olleya namhaensis]
MLSVLIPTYNYDVTTLVNSLHAQLLQSQINFEILILDDGSNHAINTTNQVLNTLAFVTFKTNAKNVGLSNNRNLLAEASIYNYILFIDGDSLVISDQYIANYLSNITTETAIIYGGRIHPKQVSKKRELRLVYGKKREDLSAKQRSEKPHKRMFCNNTLMTKATFNAITFEKTLSQYGHEDTLFAYKASVLKTAILHIDNPILHGDVDFNNVFLNKTEKGLQNLDYIYKSELIPQNFIPFLEYFSKLKRFKLNYLLAYSYYFTNPITKYLLTNKLTSLALFDIFRISYFCHINLKK